MARSVLVIDDHPGFGAQAPVLLVAAGDEVVSRPHAAGGGWPVEVSGDGAGGAGAGRGPGLGGFEDRVAAVVRGGSQVDDLPDGGTQMITEVPCDG